ncbi:hypothetical protein [Pseudonocardia alni]|uniref:hypothetical protein n=1 Tax=Pseudonocardia alni TaxID=33907 RepID=UPI0027A014B8|nr:hypothetical protein PaSha_00340 [Pseudonocardia alni]
MPSSDPTFGHFHPADSCGTPAWPLRGVALLVPWGLAAVALLFPARRGVGPGGLVALAFAPFWLVHAFLVGLLGW